MWNIFYLYQLSHIVLFFFLILFLSSSKCSNSCSWVQLTPFSLTVTINRILDVIQLICINLNQQPNWPNNDPSPNLAQPVLWTANVSTCWLKLHVLRIQQTGECFDKAIQNFVSKLHTTNYCCLTTFFSQWSHNHHLTNPIQFKFWDTTR